MVLADPLYATRENRRYLKSAHIPHSFTRIGRPPHEPPDEKRKHQRDFRQKQGQRNHIEATLDHLKNRFNLNNIKWTVPGGESMQIHLGFIAFNLHTALARG